MLYEPVIGLEIHAQLITASKLFCACASEVGGAPNERTCPVCLGLPGSLPVLNARAVDQALTVALALGCRVNAVSVFARKNYFYPDLPKGYQITQYDQPLAVGGRLAWTRRGRACSAGIVRVHLEEDAGKSMHEGFPEADRLSGIDFNRSGVPLAEIVTAPDLGSAEDAAECFRQLRAVLMEIGACDGNLEAGSLRCDANVSVRPVGSDRLGRKTEIKNLNSFRFVQRALEYEIARQTAAVSAGGTVDGATLLWDERAGRTVPMRTKEDAPDYRYFPDPDLPPLVIEPARIAARAASLPELPEARRVRLEARFGLGEDDATALAGSAAWTAYFERAAEGGNPVAAAHWMRGELARRLRETGVGIEQAPVSADGLAALIGLIDAGALSTSAAKQVLGRMFDTGEPAQTAVEALGLSLVSDEARLLEWIRAVVAGHAAVVEQHREGKRGAFGYLVGQVMKASGGTADPRLVDRLLREFLEGDRPS